MLTDAFYRTLASALRAGNDAGFAIAVGSGLPIWDQQRPVPARAVTALVSEVARRSVAAADLAFLDARGRPSDIATPRLQFSVAFDAAEAIGSLRECGLFIGGSATGESIGTLLSYFTHPRIAKVDGMVLSRTIRVDLTPRAAVAAHTTRFLGNVNQRELHDLENVTPRCQIDEIRFDRRYFFESVEEAVAAGYDFCAYCFGRDLSTR